MVLLLLLAESNEKRELHLLAYQSGASSSQAGAAKMVQRLTRHVNGYAAKMRHFAKPEALENGSLSTRCE
jgi:hypothetical protein